MMRVSNGQLKLYLIGPDKEHLFGTFALTDGRVTGTGQRGVVYEGSYADSPAGGLQVSVVAKIPKGTRVAQDLLTEAAENRTLDFYLNPNQIAGMEAKSLALPGFGSADVRFVLS